MLIVVNQIEWKSMYLVKAKAGSSYYLPGKHESAVLAFPDWERGEFPEVGESVVLHTKKEVCNRRGLSGHRQMIRTVYRFKRSTNVERAETHWVEVATPPHPEGCLVYPLYAEQDLALVVHAIGGEMKSELEEIDLEFAKLLISTRKLGDYVRNRVKIVRDGHDHPWAAPAAYIRWLSETSDPSFLSSEIDVLREAISNNFPADARLVAESSH